MDQQLLESPVESNTQLLTINIKTWGAKDTLLPLRLAT